MSDTETSIFYRDEKGEICFKDPTIGWKTTLNKEEVVEILNKFQDEVHKLRTEDDTKLERLKKLVEVGSRLNLSLSGPCLQPPIPDNWGSALRDMRRSGDLDQK